jgi:hypothetical protein
MTDFFWVLTTNLDFQNSLHWFQTHNLVEIWIQIERKAGWHWWARIFSGKRISVHRKLFQVSVFPAQQFSDRNSSCFLGFSALEDDSIYRCREQNFEPLTSSGHRSSWWHNHQHIFMPLKDTHHSHCASFLHIPAPTSKMHDWRRRRSILKQLLGDCSNKAFYFLSFRLLTVMNKAITKIWIF